MEGLATLVHLDYVLSTGYIIIEVTLAKAFTVKLPHLLLRLASVLDKRRGVRSVIVRILCFTGMEEGRQRRPG